MTQRYDTPAGGVVMKDAFVRKPGVLDREAELVKARSLIGTLMRHSIGIEKQSREMLKHIREYSLSIERQSTAMANALRREMDQYPEN